MKTVLSIPLVLLVSHLSAQTKNDSISRFSSPSPINIKNFVKMSGQWFISYRNSHEKINNNTEHKNSFYLKRSYFTLEKDLNPTFSVRYTQDITIDKEGSDAGNVETRLKYLYVRAKPQINVDWLVGLWIEVGMVHRPWLDFEQKINTYRAQDNMAIERNKIFNSADFGISINGNIGPKMDKEFLKNVNGAMKGKYLSYMIGLYNGGGYSNAEKNNNKVVAGRISIRPLPKKIPEIQASIYMNYGKGNSKLKPDFIQHLAFLAYTGKNLTLTAQYHTGKGDYKAKYVSINDSTKALNNYGYSLFGEYKFGRSPLAIWGRYDSFTVKDNTHNDITRYIGGLSYRINKNLRFILNVEHTKQLKKE